MLQRRERLRVKEPKRRVGVHLGYGVRYRNPIEASVGGKVSIGREGDECSIAALRSRFRTSGTVAVECRKEGLREHQLFNSKSWAARVINSRSFTVGCSVGGLTAITR